MAALRSWSALPLRAGGAFFRSSILIFHPMRVSSYVAPRVIDQIFRTISAETSPGAAR